MIKAEVNERRRAVIDARDMKPGQMGIVQDPANWNCTLVLKTYDDLVSLDDHTNTWRSPAFKVALLGAGESVTLTAVKDPKND